MAQLAGPTFKSKKAKRRSFLFAPPPPPPVGGGGTSNHRQSKRGRPKKEDTKTQKATTISNFVRESNLWREQLAGRQGQVLDFQSRRLLLLIILNMVCECLPGPESAGPVVNLGVAGATLGVGGLYKVHLVCSEYPGRSVEEHETSQWRPRNLVP